VHEEDLVAGEGFCVTDVMERAAPTSCHHIKSVLNSMNSDLSTDIVKILSTSSTFLCFGE